MGEVWLVEDRAAGERLALKCLAPGSAGQAEQKEALKEEFSRLAALLHPNIVRVHDYGFLESGTPYFTMDFVEGAPVTEALAGADLATVLAAVEGACAGLGTIHAAGLVHGDVKPANVLVVKGQSGSASGIRLVDFGLSGRAQGAVRPRGTPGFVAPEVLDGAAPSPRSDLYGLGVTLYTALAGESPFPGKTVGEVLREQSSRRPSPLPLRARGIPDELERVLLRLMDPDPGHRPASAAEVWKALQPVARRASGAAHPEGKASPAGGATLVRGAIVGRDAEMAAVEARSAAAGPPVLVAGLPGVGRSRFLRELALRTELAGGRAVVVSCAGRVDGGREWLRRAGLALEIGEREPSWPELLAALSSGRRIFLALEDLHAAAPADLEIARQALAATIPAGAVVVLAWAEPVLPTDSAVEDFLVLAHGPWLGEAPLSISLAPLEAEQTSGLVRLMLGETALPEIEQAAHRLSGGVPAWIEAALLTFIERKTLLHEDARWRVAPGAELPASLPALDALLEARLGALSLPARAWLAALGDLGGDAAPAAVAEVAGVEAETAAEVLAAGLAFAERSGDGSAVRAQPVAACEIARHGLAGEARHAMAARAARALADRPERAAALWIAAGDAREALEALAGPDEELSAAQSWIRAQLRLAAHELLDELAPSHLEEAAMAAEKAQRFQDAAALWERYADRAAAELADPVAAARGELRAAEAHRWLADYDRAATLLDDSERRLGEIPDAGARAPASIRASISNERAWIAMAQGDLAAAEQHARQALAGAPPDALPERFTAWNRLVAILPRLGRLDESDAAVEEALRLAHEMGDEIAEGRVRSNAVFLARVRGDLAAERAHLEASIRVSEKHGLLLHACREASALAGILVRTGKAEEARAAWGRVESLARAAGDPATLVSAASSLARLELRSGRLRRAWTLTRAAAESARRLGQTEVLAWSWNRFGMMLALLGRRRRAIRCYRRALRLWRTLPGQGGAGFSLANLAEMAMDRGYFETSGRLLVVAFDKARSVPAAATWVARSWARLAARRGDAGEIRRMLAEAPSREQAGEDIEARGALLEAAALLALAEDDVSAGIAAYEEAATLYRDHESAYPLARCLFQAARAAAGKQWESGDLVARRVAWLQEARSLYEQMGATGALQATGSDLLQLQQDFSRQGLGLSASETRDTLYGISQLLNSILDFPELIRQALELVVQRLGAERGLIVLVDPETGDLVPVARHGAVDEDTQADALQISTSIVRRVLTSGATFRSDDAVVDPRLAAMKSVFDLSLRSILCAALRLRDQVIGTIYLQNRTARGAFSDADIAFLESFSNLVAVAIENSRLHENLRKTNDTLVDENASLRREVPGQFRYANLIGRSREMAQLHALIDRFAQAPGDVLIQGDTGTGKELVAKTIHYNSPRRDRPFLSINCVALPETLIEAELFGIEDHVATGVRAREGIFERAEGGSVLLDEIGDMPPGMQARLLRVLQEREFTRVGGKRSVRMNVRVFAATNADLRERVRDGRFRPDLFFRVNRLVVQIPPLRDRKADIPPLARHFADRICQAMDRPPVRFSPQLLEVMGRSNWPGNVRELENYIERLLVVCDGPTLEPRGLPGDLEEASALAARPSISRLHGFGAQTLADALSSVERELIAEALRRSAGNRSKAARLLGMAEPTLRYRIRRLGVADEIGGEEEPRKD